MLLRVPGIGPEAAGASCGPAVRVRWVLEELRCIGVVSSGPSISSAAGAFPARRGFGRRSIAAALVDSGVFAAGAQQLSLFAPEFAPMLSAGRPGLEAAKEEAVSWIEKRM